MPSVGSSPVRERAKSLVAGRGRYTDDVTAPRMLHVAFLRSPWAHARIGAIDSTAAAAMPGVVRIFTSADLAAVCRPLETRLAHVPSHRSPVQPVLAASESAWQGEPVVAVVAATRAEAEDALEHIDIDWDALDAVADAGQALGSEAPMVHSTQATNLAFGLALDKGEVAAGFENAAAVVSHNFDFGRLAGVSLEPRAILADYNPAEGTLLVHQSHQSPHLMQGLLARHLGLPEHKVRVIAGDVGGAFGLKLHAYGDEMAVAAIALLLGRPVKFICDRLEAFLSDCQARECRITARMAVDAEGRILAIEADVLSGIGAYSIYPRSSLGDGLQAAIMIGAAYEIGGLKTRLRVAYQNKVPAGALRGIGQPLACTVTEQLIDLAARAIDLDPVEMRRRNYVPADKTDAVSRGGLALGALSLHACLDRLLEVMDYQGLRRDQAAARARGVHRGIGIATFVEQTAPGIGLYAPADIPVTAQDSCRLRLEPSGVVRGEIGCTDQGQGTMTGIAQIVADGLGIALADVTVTAGDSAGPQGGGAWASRGLAIGGEAAFAAARQLRANVLSLAGLVLQLAPEELDIRAGRLVDARDGTPRMTLAEIAAMAYFRQDLLPADVTPDLSATAHFTPRLPHLMANGVQACHLEIDVETGWIRLLGHWVVEDCGRIVNPQLVDEQIRGGVVQGLGAALFEHCLYDDQGQQLTGSLADYLVPMASEMPDIVVDHVTTLAAGTALGIKGVGEAGTIGASAAVWCAANDALRPFGATLTQQPFTPDVVLAALGLVTPTHQQRGDHAQ